jgi:diguanylate cyclase
VLFSKFSVAVNVSAKQFSNQKIVGFLQKTLAAHGLTPAALELEITESVLMDDQDSTAQVLSALTDAGFRLVIDDFGTGYSNLSYLKRFHIAKLKIDQSFVRDLITDADDAAITCGIISLAKNVGISLVAEGIETPQQRDFLLDHYCQHGQGFYLCVPLRAAELTVFLKENAMHLPRAKQARRPAYPET